MIKFFYKLILLLLSILGIGYLSRFRELFVTIIAAVAVWLLPDSEKTLILVILIFSFLSFFGIFYKTFSEKIDFNKLIFVRAIGIWIACLSPFVLFNWFWIIISLLVYHVVLSIIKSKRVSAAINNDIFNFFKNDVLTGLITMLIIQILYSGSAVFPVIYMYITN